MESPAASRFAYIKRENLATYRKYAAGILVEVAAIFVLIAAGLAVALIVSLLRP